MTQLALDLWAPAPAAPVVGVAQCGYCTCHLVLQPEGDWACNHCRPLLAQIADEGTWIRFHRLARRADYRKDCR